MNATRFFSIVCSVLMLLVAGHASACAQTGAISDGTITSPDLDQPKKDEVKAWVDAHKEGLRGGPQDIRRSRNALIEPFQRTGIPASVSFRLEATRQLSPVLRALIADQNEVVAVNALRITGELATANSVDLLTEALKDKRSGVRYAAATGFEGTFKAMQKTVPSIGGAQALRMVDPTLRQAIETEAHPRVLEGLVIALQEAARIPGKQVEGMRDAGVEALSKAVSAKTATRQVGRDADAAFRRAVLAIRTAVTNPDINEPNLKSDTLRAAAGMAGDLLALAATRMKDASEPDADLALMVKEAETAIFFIAPLLSNNATTKNPSLFELVQKGDPAFRTQVLELIGPNGSLTTAPFNFPDNRFVK